MSGLPAIAAAPLLWSCAENVVSKEPCEVGMAVTADGEAHASLARAVARAVELDGVVDVCPGRHEVKGYLDLLATGSPSTVLIRGAGMTDSVLVAGGHGLVSEAAGRSLRLSDLAIEQSATVWTGDDCTSGGESDAECDSPFDRDGLAEGALGVLGSWVFERVSITRNEGYWGGAVTVFPPVFGSATTLSFVDSEILANSSIESTSGGAVLVAIMDYYNGNPYNVTITSTNTDWGAGDTDNTPDDIAFASWDGYFHDSLAVHASYSFDGVSDFTCDADTYSCE